MIKIRCLIILNIFSVYIVKAQHEESFHHTDSERTRWGLLLNQEARWYNQPEATRIADNVLLFQRNCGGWPKNIDMARHLTAEELAEVKTDQALTDATIDNSSTFTHLRYLAKVYQATETEKYKDAFLKGLNYLFKAQYPNGGWPQFFPLRNDYSKHITFNDDAMIGVMFLLKDIIDKNSDFSFINEEENQKAKQAFEKGVDIILKTQIRINGKLTGWCAQHDETTLQPADARSYELASISGSETVRILEFLMSIEQPNDEIKQSILSACNWFEEVKIKGKRLQYAPDTTASEGYNRFLIDEVNAPDLWARFYNLKTAQPLWVDRGGIIKTTHNEISSERRNNYAYVDQFAYELLTNKLPAWKLKQRIQP